MLCCEKAAPTVCDWQVGDLVSFQRMQGSNVNRSKRWSPAARIIGFERGGKVLWVICEGIPFCLAHDKMIAADDAKVLAYQLLHGVEERLAPAVNRTRLSKSRRKRQLRMRATQ